MIRIDVQTQYSVPHLVSPSSFSRVLRDVGVHEERVLHSSNTNTKETALHNNAKETTLHNTNFKSKMRSLHTYKSQERMSTRDDVAPLYKHSILILSHTLQLLLTRTG